MDPIKQEVLKIDLEKGLTVGCALKAFKNYKSAALEEASLAEIFSTLSGISVTEINTKSLLTKLYRISKEEKSKRGEYKDRFLNMKFDIPVQTCMSHCDSKHGESEQVFETVSKSLACELVHKEKDIENKETEIKSLEKDKSLIHEKLQERRSTVRKLQETNKQLSRKNVRIKRKLELSTDTESEVKRLKKDSKLLIRQKAKVEERLKNQTVILLQNKNLKSCNKTLTSKTVALQKQVDMLKRQVADTAVRVTEVIDEKDQVVKDNSDLKKSVNDLQINCDYMEQLLNDNNSVELFDESSNSFNSKTMACVMNFSNCNVAHHKIPEVIKEVLHLAGKEPNKLPKRATIDNIVSAKAVVTQKHLSHVLPSKENLTLYTDETRKFGKTYNTYIVTDENKSPYFLGLREMFNKSAQTAFDTFQTILTDLTDCERSENSVGDRIISNIVNTMSDRASTEKAFNNLLENYRKDILPDLTTGWEELTERQRDSCTKIHTFFCGLHLLVAFAEVSGKCLLEFEHTLMDKALGSETDEEVKSEFWNASESATVRLIRAASKCLSRGGDEKSGCYADFHTYLSLTKQRVKFIRYHGNRFNVIFFLAEVLYYHHRDVITFFEKHHLPTNRLQKAVYLDIKENVLIASCKVLGLISKLITAPLWRILESGSTHILDMNNYYVVLLQYFERISKDSSGFLTGEEYPFDSDYIHKDEVYSALVLENESVDEHAAQIAQTLATALHALVKRMLSDQLPGGKYFETNDDIRKRTTSVIPHNKLPEFAFGVLDFQLRYRPNASTLVNEAFLMYTMNKTSEWIGSLSDDELDKLMKESRKDGRKYRETFKARCREIQEQRRRILAEKAAEAERKSEKKKKQKEEIISNILYYELWQTENQITEALGRIHSDQEKREALKWQLKFRRFVLEQKHKDRTVFNFSKKGIDFTINELIGNLKKLLNEALKGPCNERARTNAPLLVGKRIQHTFQEDTYLGRVVSVVPSYPDWYNVVYDQDEAVYTYKLLEDYRNGDLKILPKPVEAEKTQSK